MSASRPAPTFGDAGAGYLRLCFARDAGQLREATDRLASLDHAAMRSAARDRRRGQGAG